MIRDSDYDFDPESLSLLRALSFLLFLSDRLNVFLHVFTSPSVFPFEERGKDRETGSVSVRFFVKKKKKRGKIEFCVCACAYKQPGIAFGGNEGTCAASSDAYPPVRLRTHV